MYTNNNPTEYNIADMNSILQCNNNTGILPNTSGSVFYTYITCVTDIIMSVFKLLMISVLNTS